MTKRKNRALKRGLFIRTSNKIKAANRKIGMRGGIRL